MSTADLVAYVYSLAIGLLVGIERERSNRSSPPQAFGIRTFALLALVGTLSISVGSGAMIVATIAVAGLVIIGYQRTSQEDPGTTTEVAAMATFLLGVLCHRDAALAAGLAILMTILLASKVRLHSFVRDALSQTEIEDALKFLVIGFVVLPLLPNRGLGPYGVLNPSRIWLIVVALTGISWLGYLAVRILGPRRGLIATGLASGFISATAATASMGRSARSAPALRAAVGGAQMASVATFLQLEIILLVVSPSLALRLLLPAACGVLVLSTVALRGFGKHLPATSTKVAGRDGQTSHGDRVVTLLPAVVLAVILTGALLVGRWGTSVFGAKGAVLVAGAAGLADAHGGSLAAATMFAKGLLSLDATMFAIGAALLSNALVKCVVAFASGGGRFGRRFSAGLILAMAVFAVVLLLTRLAA